MSTSCGCKGIRTCLICERNRTERDNADGGQDNSKGMVTIKKLLVFCRDCGDKAWPLQKARDPTTLLSLDHHLHTPSSDLYQKFPGVLVLPDFVSVEEEAGLAESVDSFEWKASQSGRRKQDFGPKVNFKKRKVKFATFTGLPAFTEWLVERMGAVPLLQGFVPVEQCNLDYDTARGSSIDPHYDDSWLWGERLVTLNLLADTHLTMTQEESTSSTDGGNQESNLASCVKIPMPRRSLVVLHAGARYQWMHSITRDSIHSRRIAITFRELSAEFLEGGLNNAIGKQITEVALSFSGDVVL